MGPAEKNTLNAQLPVRGATRARPGGAGGPGLPGRGAGPRRRRRGRLEGFRPGDRSLLGPTAQTLHEGDISISDYEIVALGLSYGATDRVEVSFTTSIPVLHFAGVLAVKTRVFSSSVVTVAVQAAFGYVYNVRSTHVLTLAVLGLVDLHTPDGLLLWTNSIGLAQPYSRGEDWSGRNTTVPLWSFTTGPVVRVRPNVRLLANLVVLGGFGQVHAVSQPRSTDFTVWASSPTACASPRNAGPSTSGSGARWSAGGRPMAGWPRAFPSPP